MKYQNYKNARSIIVSDYSEYKEGKSNNGGCYGFDTVYKKVPNKDIWHATEYTTGEFCPYCHSFDCCGNCEQAEYDQAVEYSVRDILHALHNAKNNGFEIDLVF